MNNNVCWVRTSKIFDALYIKFILPFECLMVILNFFHKLFQVITTFFKNLGAVKSNDSNNFVVKKGHLLIEGLQK